MKGDDDVRRIQYKADTVGIDNLGVRWSEKIINVEIPRISCLLI